MRGPREQRNHLLVVLAALRAVLGRFSRGPKVEVYARRPLDDRRRGPDEKKRAQLCHAVAFCADRRSVSSEQTRGAVGLGRVY
jgi:hypothetical protein